MSRQAVIRKPGPKGTFLLQNSSLGERMKLFLRSNIFLNCQVAILPLKRNVTVCFCLDLTKKN